MINPMFSIFDKKSGRYTTPQCDINEATALRNFGQAVNTDGIFNYSPADFDFYHVADFEVETGRITVCDPLEFIVNAAALIGE